MNLIGEYTLKYNIYTMFDVYTVKITNHNLITDNGYDFFLSKWYQEDNYPFEVGYYNQKEEKFYREHPSENSYIVDLSTNPDGTYSTTTKYIDKSSNKEYRYDVNKKKFIGFTEVINTICIGKCDYIDELSSKPSHNDISLYDSQSKEYEITDTDGYDRQNNELKLLYELENEDLDGTTEIGIKTNHGRLVSHDIHAPYHLPFESKMTLEYVFKLN